jgi:hypothetical protein
MQIMQIFQKYAPSFSAVCKGGSNMDAITTYIYNASLNSCKDKFREHSATIIKRDIIYHDKISSPELRTLLPAITAMMTMSRLEPEHRIKHENFGIALKQKLRLPIEDNCHSHHYICTCKQKVDPYMDHSLGCHQCS